MLVLKTKSYVKLAQVMFALSISNRVGVDNCNLITGGSSKAFTGGGRLDFMSFPGLEAFALPQDLTFKDHCLRIKDLPVIEFTEDALPSGRRYLSLTTLASGLITSGAEQDIVDKALARATRYKELYMVQRTPASVGAVDRVTNYDPLDPDKYMTDEIYEARNRIIARQNDAIILANATFGVVSEQAIYSRAVLSVVRDACNYTVMDVSETESIYYHNENGVVTTLSENELAKAGVIYP